MDIIKKIIKGNPKIYWFIQNIIRTIKGFIPYSFRKYKNDAFHGDIIWQNLVRELSEVLDFTSFVETGTFRATTTLFLANIFFEIPIFTIEIKKKLVKESKWRLRKVSNAQVIKGSSSEIIPHLIKEDKLGIFPFFFLDAHSGTIPPINDELKAINRLEKAIIMIDDFKVPSKSEFKFNSYAKEDGNKISLDFDFIKENIHSDRHRILVPDYSLKEAGNILSNKFRGHIIICQNLNEKEWAKLLQLATVKDHYKVG